MGRGSRSATLTNSTLAGNRQFAWFKPAGRRPTQYEAYSVGQQSTPAQWLHVDWPLRFEDGRAPYVEESTALRCTEWGGYRDPTQTWQRPYVAQHNQQEQVIAALIPEALRDGLSSTLVPAWRDRVLGVYYAAWPFLEYGEFLCLCYAVREALADTLTLSLAFTASDKLRHSQNIVLYLLTLQELEPSFSDAAARGAWMADPLLVPLRETIERIYSLDDWAETLLAIHLVLEPLAGDLFKTEFLSRLAPLNGDAVTPLILAGVRQDDRRHLSAAHALMQHVLRDTQHAAANRALIAGWLGKWMPHAEAAARALAPVFAIEGITSVPFDACFERVQMRQRSMLADLGFAPGDWS